ncbi:MAG: hypothetical protein IJ706_08065 [Clostridia bacterium]|nr:hypothetical protein [Clostridia bacterium]
MIKLCFNTLYPTFLFYIDYSLFERFFRSLRSVRMTIRGEGQNDNKGRGAE